MLLLEQEELLLLSLSLRMMFVEAAQARVPPALQFAKAAMSVRAPQVCALRMRAGGRWRCSRSARPP